MERYEPTEQDVERLKPKKDRLKVSGDGVFTTLQGEGSTAGSPSVFLRLHYCNLTCGKPNGWKCDTGYTWDTDTPEYWREPEDWPYQETASRIENAWSEEFEADAEKRLVITGGEPLIQQEKIAQLLDRLPGWEVEIETNGTIMPIPELQECQFNCSPKLANSGNSLRRRYKPEVLKAINDLPRSQFKFVVVRPDDLEEIESMVIECGLDTEKILIMPEGRTADEVQSHADLVRDEVRRRDWEIAMRNQLIWFGNRRRT